MSTFVAVSSRAPLARIASLAPRAETAIRRRSATDVVELVRTDNAALWASRDATWHTDQRGVTAVTTCASLHDLVAGQRYAVADIAAQSTSDLASLNLDAPAGIVCCDAVSGRLTAVVDYAGAYHLYACVTDDATWISNSALVLAAILQRPYDWAAISVWLRLGNFLGSETAFEGIKKLPARHAWEGERGEVTLRRTAPEPDTASQLASAADMTAAAASIADLLRAAAEHAIEMFPRAGVELSGGFDSRLVLALLPRGAREARIAFTLGGDDAPDVVVARRLAKRDGLDHRAIALVAPSDETAAEFVGLAERIGLRSDFVRDPVFSAILSQAYRDLPDTPWFTGQGGEIGRAFYYPAQPLQSPVSRGLVQRLAEWRMLANESIQPILLADGVSRASEERVVAGAWACVGDCTSWGRALDRLYLASRIERLVGAEFSAVCGHRTVLAPFCTRAYIDAALAAPCTWLAGSRLFCAVLQRCDPDLVDLPLAGGGRPADRLNNGPMARIRRGRDLLAKVGRRAWQRLRRTGKTAVGTAAAAGVLQRNRRVTELVIGVADASPLLDARRVETALSAGGLDANSLGYLLSLALMNEFRESVGRIADPIIEEAAAW